MYIKLLMGYLMIKSVDSYYPTGEVNDNFEFFEMKLYSILVQVGTVRIMGLIYIVFKIYRFLRKRSSFRHILAHLIIGFMYDFVTRYVKLMGRFEEYNSTVTKQCDTSKMSTTEWILFIFSSTNCEKKFVKFSHVLEDQFIELLDLVGNVLKFLRSSLSYLFGR